MTCIARPVVAAASLEETPPRARQRLGGPIKTKASPDGEAFLDKAPGGDLLLHGKATLPSAHARFTSEFGMGSGGTTPLWPPGKGLKQRIARQLQSGVKPFEESAKDGGFALRERDFASNKT